MKLCCEAESCFRDSEVIYRIHVAKYWDACVRLCPYHARKFREEVGDHLILEKWNLLKHIWKAV